MKQVVWMAVGFALVAGAQEQERPQTIESPVREIVVKCEFCAARGSYVARPPDLDQFKGKMDSREHWDIKVKRCPLCEGLGRRKIYDLTRVPPRADVIPCRLCGWSGIMKCTKCTATGLVKCPNRECQDGWLIEKPKNRKSHRRAESVEMCRECQGKGKVKCPECLGMRAVLCRRCNGVGRDLDKERREKERREKDAERAQEKAKREAERAQEKAKREAERAQEKAWREARRAGAGGRP